MSVRPTRRGDAVIVGILAALAAGAMFGPRTLDAVVLPGVIALIAAAVQLRRAPEIRLDRTLPPADVPDTSRQVEIALDGDRTAPATVRDRLPAGVDAAAAESAAGSEAHEAVVSAAIGGDAVAYEVVPTRRGKHVLGPATVEVTDILGLLNRSVTVDSRDTMVVYPRVTTLPTAIRADLRTAYQAREANQREEFEDLREYVRGDAVRDIHWKSSARHDELMVMEFTDRADPDRVTIAAGVAQDSSAGDESGSWRTENAEDTAATAADTMAEAAASVCVSLVRDGVSVTLTSPSGRVDAAPGRLRPALGHLAVAEAGPVPTRGADVVIVAREDSASIRFDGREHRFEGVSGDSDTVEVKSQPGRIESCDAVEPNQGAGEPGVSAFGDRTEASVAIGSTGETQDDTRTRGETG